MLRVDWNNSTSGLESIQLRESKDSLGFGSRDNMSRKEHESSGSGLSTIKSFLGWSSNKRKMILHQNLPYFFVQDYMHSLVALSWCSMFALIFVASVAMVVLFACLFQWANPGGKFSDAYTLSIQTWTTIGYGVLSPQSDAEQIVAYMTFFVSFIFTSIVAGIAFIKFSLPNAGVSFSRVACVHRTASGRSVLVLRVAINRDQESLVNLRFHLILLEPRASKEGVMTLEPTVLTLTDPNPLMLFGTCTLTHVIEPGSPLELFVNGGLDGARQSNAILSARMVAYSLSFKTEVAAQRVYHATEIEINRMFNPMISVGEETRVHLAYLDKTHSVSNDPVHALKTHIANRKLSLSFDMKRKKRALLERRRLSDTKRRNLRALAAGRSSFRYKPGVAREAEERCNCLSSGGCCSAMRNCHYSEPSTPSQLDSIWAPRVDGVEWSTQIRRSKFWYFMLTQSPWWLLLLVLFLLVLLFVMGFALLMYADPESLEGSNGDFQLYVYWSMHTLSTIGYGSLTPGNAYGHLMVTIEGTYGLVGIALLAGVTWSKFAFLKPRVKFSQIAAVTTFDGEPHLMIRVAPLWRGHVIMWGDLRVCAQVECVDEKTQEVSTHQEELKLVRRDQLFTLSAMYMHKITPKSPFFSLLSTQRRSSILTSSRQKSTGAIVKVIRILCLLECFDQLFQQKVLGRAIYEINEESNSDYSYGEGPQGGAGERPKGSVPIVKFGYRHEDAVRQDPVTSQIVVDYNLLDKVVPDKENRRISCVSITPEYASPMGVRTNSLVTEDFTFDGSDGDEMKSQSVDRTASLLSGAGGSPLAESQELVNAQPAMKILISPSSTEAAHKPHAPRIELRTGDARAPQPSQEVGQTGVNTTALSRTVLRADAAAAIDKMAPAVRLAVGVDVLANLREDILEAGWPKKPITQSI